MANIKYVKVRALFAKNKVCFARAEQLCFLLITHIVLKTGPIIPEKYAIQEHNRPIKSIVPAVGGTKGQPFDNFSHNYIHTIYLHCP